MTLDLENLEKNLKKTIEKAITSLPNDTIKALERAKKMENNGAKVQINNMIKSVNIGEKKKIPICQDTGIPTFFVRIGSNYPELNDIGKIKPIIKKAVKESTDEIPLRPNSVHPLTDKNTGNNLGEHIPYIDWKIMEDNKIRIDFMPKGGGSENMSQLTMMNPSKGLNGVKNIVLKRISSMEGKPCPPTVIGVGLGGGSNIAMNLAKESLLRPIGEHHKESKISKLEKELKQKANELGIGPMGVGGETTVLDIKIEYAHRHPASFPVGIVVQCWCNRRKSLIIEPEGKVKILK